MSASSAAGARGLRRDALGPLVDALRAPRVSGPAGRGSKLGTVTVAAPLQVIIDGETVPSPRVYARSAQYSPTVGDRVLLLPAGSTYVVAFAVVGG